VPLTPETLPRHELCGLRVRVAAAPNSDLVGVGGRVVRETQQTLVVSRAGAAGERRVPKRGSILEFALGPATPDTTTDEAAAARAPAGTGVDPSDAAHVTVAGGRLLSRPARRTADGPTPDGDDRWR
jgi:RNase P/RNase MRP subunit p29